jgi:SpoVK/Ycf46/Vps4 family AAA+-type ATPase
MSSRKIRVEGNVENSVIIQGDYYGYQEQKISYIVLEVDKTNHYNNTFQQIASTINVNLYEKEQEVLPFIHPKDFDSWKDQKKLLLYGVWGCGKSRTILELLRDQGSIARYQNIYILAK